MPLACSHEPEGPPPPPLLDRPNVVLITIDTLRADHLGCYGYFRDTTPCIDAFAKESVVFDSAYATMATTLPSHTSMFTARYPLEHGIFANLTHGGNPFGWKPGMMSFAQVAKAAGYTTAGFVSAAPLKYQSGINAGFDKWSEPGPEDVERRAGETMAEVVPWLDTKPQEPFFLWVHFYDPHWKHHAPPPYDTMFAGKKDKNELEAWIQARGIPDESTRSNGRKVTATRSALDDYCGEVRYADSQFGVLIEELRKRGELDKTIVVFCADHGEGLNQHDWTAHGLVWDEQLRVPLIMRFPPQAKIAPHRVSSIVSLIDMFPTVLARMKPWATDEEKKYLAQATGTDVLAPQFKERPVLGQRTERELAEDPGEMYAVTTHQWKYIHEPEVGDKLFDRTKDPFELDNLLVREPKAAENVHELMDSMMTEQKARGASAGQSVEGKADPELLKQMRKLGYAGGEDDPNDLVKRPPKNPAEPEKKAPPKDEPPKKD